MFAAAFFAPAAAHTTRSFQPGSGSPTRASAAAAAAAMEAAAAAAPSPNRQGAGERGSSSSSVPPGAGGSSRAPAPAEGPPVPQGVLRRMAQYAGDEGLARPATAVPSALRLDRADSGPPVPPEVLQYTAQYTGGEGGARPSTASPSVLLHASGSSSSRLAELAVPDTVLHMAAQFQAGEWILDPAR